MKPIIFGEVLFDVFNNEVEILGGAPFNAAWHLKGFGLSPIIISRIGNDKAGQEVIKAMNNWGLSDIGIQFDSKHPTGRVSITQTGKDHSFTIHENAAFDFITDELMDFSFDQQEVPLFYHGTLVLRSENPRRALTKFKSKFSGTIFYDVNLRDPWWDIDTINCELGRSNLVKCNEEELAVLARLFGIKDSGLENTAAAFIKKFSLDKIYITMGAEGAFLVDKFGQTVSSPQIRVKDIVDTVGAGDAFSSVVMLGNIYGWEDKVSLERAADFAAKICSRKGAVQNDAALYEYYLKNWGLKHDESR